MDQKVSLLQFAITTALLNENF